MHDPFLFGRVHLCAWADYVELALSESDARIGCEHMLTSDVPHLPAARVLRHLAGLPVAEGYSVHVTALHYGEKPHLSAITRFDERSITLEIPEPFYPFGEIIPYGAKRLPGRGEMRFIWLTEGVTFRSTRDVLRFLYLHEWMHWYLRECRARKSQAETACDRFALHNCRRRAVSIADAELAVRRDPRRSGSAGPPGDDLSTQASLWEDETSERYSRA